MRLLDWKLNENINTHAKTIEIEFSIEAITFLLTLACPPRQIYLNSHYFTPLEIEDFLFFAMHCNYFVVEVWKPNASLQNTLDKTFQKMGLGITL